MNKKLSDLPNIGATLEQKLHTVGIQTESELKQTGAENVIIKLATLEDHGVCINMLYAIEGAIQGIRWHQLDKARKTELLEFHRMMCRSDKINLK